MWDVGGLYSISTWASSSLLLILRHSQMPFVSLFLLEPILLLLIFSFIDLQVCRGCSKSHGVSPACHCHLSPFCPQNWHQLVSAIEQEVRVATIKLKFSLGVSTFQDKSFLLLVFIDLALTSCPFFIQMLLQYLKCQFLGLVDLLSLAVLSEVFAISRLS